MAKRIAYSYIRFSSAEQRKGDSLRRQTALSEEYAAANNLTLDDTLSLLDLGVSAYKGANRTEGALKRFLDAVETGRVKPGSWLLVESLDRLSRDTLDNALTLFLQLLQSGITVVTLGDLKVFNKKSVASNSTDLILSLLIFARANEESETKSKRIRAAGAKKLAEARDDGKPMGGNLPAWIKLSRDKSHYLVREDRVAIVQRIYDRASSSSMGGWAIARELTQEGVPPFGNATHWHLSSVHRILTNRAVLGEYGPKIKVDGRQVDNGEPILNYYPQIIPAKQFTEVQKARLGREQTLRGRKGKAFTNLLQGLAKCNCGASLRYNPHGKTKQSYLVCSLARGSTGRCPHVGFRYPAVEAAILSSLTELNWKSLIAKSQPNHKARTAILESRLIVLRDGLKASQDKLSALVEAIGTRSSKLKTLVEAVAQSEKEAVTKASELEEAAEALQEHHRDTEKANETASSFTSAVDLLASVTNPPDLYALRSKVHHLLTQLLSELFVCEFPKDDAQRERAILELLPAEKQNFFATKSREKILVVRYRLKEDVLQMKARIILINTTTSQVASFIEAVPRPTADKPQKAATERPQIPDEWIAALPASVRKGSLREQLMHLPEEQWHAVISSAEDGTETFYQTLQPSPWLKRTD